MVGRIFQGVFGIVFLITAPIWLLGGRWTVTTRSSTNPRRASGELSPAVRCLLTFVWGWFGVAFLALALLPEGGVRDWFYERGLGLALAPWFFYAGIKCLTLSESRMHRAPPSTAEDDDSANLVEQIAEGGVLGAVAPTVGSRLPTRAALDLSGAILAGIGCLTLYSLFRSVDLEDVFSPMRGHLGRSAIATVVLLAAGAIFLLIADGVRRSYRWWLRRPARHSPP